MRHEAAQILINLYRRERLLPLGSRRRSLERHHNISDPLVGGQDDVFGVLFFPAVVLIDRQGDLLLFHGLTR